MNVNLILFGFQIKDALLITGASLRLLTQQNSTQNRNTFINFEQGNTFFIRVLFTITSSAQNDIEPVYLS